MCTVTEYSMVDLLTRPTYNFRADDCYRAHDFRTDYPPSPPPITLSTYVRLPAFLVLIRTFTKRAYQIARTRTSDIEKVGIKRFREEIDRARFSAATTAKKTISTRAPDVRGIERRAPPPTASCFLFDIESRRFHFFPVNLQQWIDSQFSCAARTTDL